MNERERKQQIINLAIEEYLNTPELERSLTKLGEKLLDIYMKMQIFIQKENIINIQNSAPWRMKVL